MSSVRKPVQLENEEAPIRLTDVGITMFDKAVCAKAPSEILLTEVGINTQFREEHPLNALAPILRTDVGILTTVSLEQNLNALAPIEVIVVGMVTDTRLHVPPHEELEKEFSETLVSVVGIIITKENKPH